MRVTTCVPAAATPATRPVGGGVAAHSKRSSPRASRRQSRSVPSPHSSTSGAGAPSRNPTSIARGGLASTRSSTMSPPAPLTDACIGGTANRKRASSQGSFGSAPGTGGAASTDLPGAEGFHRMPLGGSRCQSGGRPLQCAPSSVISPARTRSAACITASQCAGASRRRSARVASGSRRLATASGDGAARSAARSAPNEGSPERRVATIRNGPSGRRAHSRSLVAPDSASHARINIGSGASVRGSRERRTWRLASFASLTAAARPPARSLQRRRRS